MNTANFRGDYLSILVSIVVFAVGVKVGKERTDRGVLRAEYSSILEYFNLLSSVSRSHGIQNEGGHLSRFQEARLQADLKVIAHKNEHGSLSLLPKYLQNRFLDTEEDLIDAATEVGKHIRTEVIPTIKRRFLFDVKELRSFPYQEPSKFVSAEKFSRDSNEPLKQILAKLEGDDCVMIDVSTYQNDHSMVYIRQDLLREGTIDEYLLALHRDIEELRTPSYLRLKGDIETLKSRIHDPHPMWGTFCGPIRDFFR